MSLISSMFAQRKRARPSGPAPAPVPEPIVQVGNNGLTGFRHGFNVIVGGSNLKGLHATVSEFNPAMYELRVSGTDFVDVRPYEQISQVGETIFTELGESLVRDYIRANRNHKYFAVYLFREPNNPNTQIGIEIPKKSFVEENLKRRYDAYLVPNYLSDQMRVFVYKMEIDDNLAQVTNALSQLNFDETQDLINQMGQLNIQNQQNQNQLNTLIQKLNEHHDAILDKVYNPEYAEQFDVTMIIKSNILEKYFVNKDNFNDVKNMDPSIDHYLVDYVRNQKFKLNQLQRPAALTTFEQQIKRREDIKRRLLGESLQNFYPESVTVTSGPFRGKSFPFVAFYPAHLRLNVHGNNISVHRVVIRDDSGNKLQTIESRIFDTDVFYQDIILDNGEYAQIHRIDPMNNQLLRIITRSGREQVLHVFNDKYRLNQGVKLIYDTTATEEEEPQAQAQDMFAMDAEVSGEPEITDDYDEGEADIDYGEVEETRTLDDGEPVDEQQLKKTFKDLERTQRELRQLTSEEKTIQNEIQNVLDKLGANVDFNMYDMVDKVNDMITKMSKLNIININLRVTVNIKYIVVCMVLYELLRSQFSITLDDAVDLLFKKYFNTNDLRENSLNQTIFIKVGDWNPNVSQDHLAPILGRISEYLRSKNYKEILRTVLTNADTILQSVVGISVNLNTRRSTIPADLIPLGLNLQTGKRYKDEELEESLQRLRRAKHRITNTMTVSDLINGNLPNTEMPVYWIEPYLSVLNTYIQELNTQANNLEMAGNINEANAYRTVIPHLEKGPFGRNHVGNQSELFNQLYRQLRAKLTTSVLERTRTRIAREQQREQEQQSRYQGPDVPTPELVTRSRGDDIIRKMLKRNQQRREEESRQQTTRNAPFVPLSEHHIQVSQEVADVPRPQKRSKKSKPSKLAYVNPETSESGSSSSQ